MVVDKKKIKDCKILSIRYKIVKSNFQELRLLMYTLVKIKSGKHYKLLIIHKKRLTYIVVIEINEKILGSLITYMYKN